MAFKDSEYYNNLQYKYIKHKNDVFRNKGNSECDRLLYMRFVAFEAWLKDPCNNELLDNWHQAKKSWEDALDEKHRLKPEN